MATVDEMENTHCAECKMIVFTGEYHPYTACVLYRQLGQADKVRGCLDAVIEYAHRTASTPPVSQGARAAAEEIYQICLAGAGTSIPSLREIEYAISKHCVTASSQGEGEAELTAAFHRGVDAAKDAVRSEVDKSNNDDAHFYAAVYINAIARKCGFDRPTNVTVFCPQCAVRVPLEPLTTVRTSDDQQPWADVCCPICHFVIATVGTDHEGTFAFASAVTTLPAEGTDSG